jgi:Tfp pilus assembly protein PilX
MEHKQLKSSRHLRSEQGVALILVLMLVVLTTIMILAFFLSVQTETRSVRSVVSGQNSKQLADLAVQTVVNQIQQATTQNESGGSYTWGNVAWVSQPGLIRCYDYTGTPIAWYKLYSSATPTLLSTSNAITETLSSVQADLPTSPWATAGSANYGVYTDVNSPVYASDGSSTRPAQRRSQRPLPLLPAHLRLQ